MENINIAEAKSRFSELVSRSAAGEKFIIKRRERPVAAMIGFDELDRLERAAYSARRLAELLGQKEELLDKIEKGEAHPVMAAFGLWEDEPDLADLDSEIINNRLAELKRRAIGRLSE